MWLPWGKFQFKGCLYIYSPRKAVSIVFNPSYSAHVRDLWDFKAGSSEAGHLNLGKRSVRLKAFHRKARFESICLVGFLPINVLYNQRIPLQQRSEDQMNRVAPLPTLTPHNSSNKPFYFIQPLLQHLWSVSVGQANVSFAIGRKGISRHNSYSILFQQFQGEIHRA